MPSVGVATAGDAGVVGVLGPLGVPFDGAATADGSAGGCSAPLHAASAAKEASRETVVSAFRMTLR